MTSSARGMQMPGGTLEESDSAPGKGGSRRERETELLPYSPFNMESYADAYTTFMRNIGGRNQLISSTSDLMLRTQCDGKWPWARAAA